MELPVRRQPSQALAPMRAREPNNMMVQRGYWASSLNQCCDDEETCWIGTWCSFLLSGRTAAQFQVVNSMMYFGFSSIYWVLIMISLFTGSEGFLVLLSVFGCCVWPFIQAHTRQTIRGKLGIHGTFCQDWCVHCCCCTHSCALCQEAREAKAAGLPMVDLCSGELLPDMSALAPTTDLVDGSNMIQTPVTSVHSIKDGDRGDDTPTVMSTTQVADGARMSMTYISKMGNIVLLFEALIFIASVAVLFAVGRYSAVLILCLVFVQPFLVLYYFYWNKQRNTVQLDAIIKLFATGFFVTTFQSWCFEQLIETVGIILFAPWIANALNEPGTVDDDRALQPGVSVDDATSTTAMMGGDHRSVVEALISRVMSMTAMGSVTGGLTALWQHVTALTGLPSASENVNFAHVNNLLHSQEGGDTALIGDDTTTESSIQAIVGRNWFAVFLACFFMAFCVAAAVEETMKQFIVRCHRFATPMADPYTVTTYLMAGALGFTTCENMLYVFNTGAQSPVPGTSIFIGEIMVLLLRVCLPVHLICSVLQGANLSRIIMGKLPNMGLLSMIFSAIVLHGTFDCTLFVMSMIAFANDIDGFWFDALTYAVAFCIAGFGSLYAYKQWKNVTNDFDHGWHQVSAGSTHNALLQDEDV